MLDAVFECECSKLDENIKESKFEAVRRLVKKGAELSEEDC